MDIAIVDSKHPASRKISGGAFRAQALALVICCLLISPPLAAEILRLGLKGQLNDDGLSVNADYDNATFSGFFEIDLSKPLSNPASIRFYEMTSWAINLVPAPPNPNDAPIIRFSNDGEPDDKGRIFLNRSSNRISVPIEEDNSPASRRLFQPIFDANFNILSGTRFEDLLTADKESFLTMPDFYSGALQFGVSSISTSMMNASLRLALRYVDGVSGDDDGGTNDCSSPSSPCATIQHAIDSAQPWDGVIVADAVYTETLVVDKALDIRGESREGTIIQAAANRGQANDRVISVDNDTYFELSDLTIRHGKSGTDNGGGLKGIGGDLLIERVLFTRNDTDGAGAGLSWGDGVVVMNDVIFRENGDSATDEAGGASVGQSQALTEATLTNVVFENNTAGNGGGLVLFNAQSILNKVSFFGNTTPGDGGGLVYQGRNSVVSSLTLRDSVFKGNSAGEGGGGMYSVTDDTPYTMVNVLFSGNLAKLGGALFNERGLAAGSRVLTNVTMSGNRAQRRGGAIDKPLDMSFRNTVIWNNSDSSGTGTAEATMDDFSSSSIVEVSNSLLQGYPAGEFPGSSNIDGTNPNNNPDFVTPVSPVGAPSLFGNLRLQDTSPLIDAGNNTFVAGISTDLDGLTRINNGTVDLGPYETGNDKLFHDRFEQQ